MQRIGLVVFLLFIFITKVFAAVPVDEERFFFDALAFRSDSHPDSVRLDIFVVVGYEQLLFNMMNSQYTAKYSVTLNITREDNVVVFNKRYARNPIASDYFSAQGGNAEFSRVTDAIMLPPGDYRLRAILKDELSGFEYEKSRRVQLFNFNDWDVSASSVMLVSNIEERDGGYIITPHISDNVINLTEGYFAFFEIYNKGAEREIAITTEIKRTDSSELYSSQELRKIKSGTEQVYIRIPNTIKYDLKPMTLRFLLKEVKTELAGSDVSGGKILSATSRTISNVSTLLTKLADSLDLSIRRLRYVASRAEMDTINADTNSAERFRRFSEFWKRLDPTPNTERNEAMEEYYQRVEYANKNFKSRSEGWLTDMGHIYIVFGQPTSIDQTNRSMADNRTYVEWRYGNDRSFIFVDVSGFGDYRLYSPSVVTDQYKYGE